MIKIALYNLAFIKTMTGIEDDTIAAFYADSVILAIERVIGYSLSEESKKDYIKGVDNCNIWLLRKPVTAITEVKVRDVVLTVDEDYTTRDLDTTPRVILENDILCKYEEAEITSTAGYKEDGAGDPQLPKDILMFIISMIKEFESSVDNGGLTSYKIDTISYGFNSHLTKNQNFYNGIYTIFGI